MAEDTLKKPAIFLSAGVPDQPERGDYIDTADPVAIRDATRAVTAAVLRSGKYLVFGGHPAITPLVAQVAGSLKMLDRVVIFQSEWFEKMTPKEVDWFENLHWTRKMESIGASVLQMRDEMFGAKDLDYRAAVYLGGMNGVEDEHERFHAKFPKVPEYPVGSTGGAALNLWGDYRFESAELKRALREDLHYRSLFEEVLG